MFLGAHFILAQPFSEHHSSYYKDFKFDKDFFLELPSPILFKNKENCICFGVNNDLKVENSYYIGVDWVTKDKAVYVQPKINTVDQQTDYINMLFSALKHADVAKHTSELFEIKFQSPYIEIHQEQDLLTPLLVVQFLHLMQKIVKKGLRKSYYRLEENLNGRIKGKILIAKTIKQNHLKNKNSNIWCTYEEFGVNNLENRLLNKALVFIQRYLPSLNISQSINSANLLLNYIKPAFQNVSEDVSVNDIKKIKVNTFYKEYKEAIEIAKLILKRFGYNIHNTQASINIKTPPFWIDMSKLFELYVLGLLKDQYTSNILYGKDEIQVNYGLPDYLFKKAGYEMIIDAKYKLLYDSAPFQEDENECVKSKYDIDNIRQIAGYARDKKVLSILGKNEDDVVKCLIIYPKKTLGSVGKLDLFKMEPINQFSHFYKLGVELPSL